MSRLAPGRDGRVGRYLRTNDKQWTPPAIITYDTESYRDERQDGEDQRLRLWCARLDDRRPPHRGQPGQLRERGADGIELAHVIDKWLSGRRTCWLYCHNLGYDLTTSQLVTYLAALGWNVEHCSTVPQYIFLTLAKGERRLTMTDLHHIIPMRLADIGLMLGIPKIPIPKGEQSDSDWYGYCARDVDILAEAVLALMEHWDTYGLGNWAVSGAACGFRAMRHMMPKKSVTLIEDPDASKNERAGIYGGRRYCWRHGEQPPGRYSELDFTMAHATTAANYAMPAKRGTWFDTLPFDHRAIDGKLAVVIAEVEVETDVPRFPCRAGDRVWYPVGRFRTVLASPEIAWARDLGCLRSIGRGQFHYTSHVLRPFFQRVIDTVSSPDEQFPPIVKALWKQWGRSVIGKFAQRGYAVTETRMLTDKPWYYERATDWETGGEYWLVHYNGRIHEARPSGDGASAYPAILALVESYERVALGKAAEMLGEHALIQCDTDGMWVNTGVLENGTAGRLGFDLSEVPREARIDLAVSVVNQQIGALQLREKHSVQRIAVWGPQNYDAGPYTRHSGRPGGLREIQPGVWAGDIFPAVAHQMAVSEPGVYRTEQVTWSRPANVVPGWVLDTGHVRAVEVTSAPPGQADVRPYSESRHAQRGEALAPVQHTALAGLWEPPAPPPGAIGDGDQDQAASDAGGAAAELVTRAGRAELALLRSQLRTVRLTWRRHERGCQDCHQAGTNTAEYCRTGWNLAQAITQRSLAVDKALELVATGQKAMLLQARKCSHPPGRNRICHSMYRRRAHRCPVTHHVTRACAGKTSSRRTRMRSRQQKPISSG